MEETVSGEFSFREHVVAGVQKYAAHVEEDIPTLAGRLVTTGLEDLLKVEGGLHGIAKIEKFQKTLFGSGPTSGREVVPWYVDANVHQAYLDWCMANRAAVEGVMSGFFLEGLATEVLATEGLADQLGIRRYTMSMWRLESDMRYRRTFGTLSSLRSEEARGRFGGGCLDRDAHW